YMRRIVLVSIPMLVGLLALAQTAFDNNSVIKLIKAGLSEDLIGSPGDTVPGIYDTSADGLIALKTGGASDKVVSAIVLKVSSARLSTQVSDPPPAATAAPLSSEKQG